MADYGSQWVAMAIAHSEYQSGFDSLILNYSVTLFTPAGQVNSPQNFLTFFSTFFDALEQVPPFLPIAASVPQVLGINCAFPVLRELTKRPGSAAKSVAWFM
jgi:hypothetical protein